MSLLYVRLSMGEDVGVYVRAGMETCGGIVPSFRIVLDTNVVSRSGGSQTALEVGR